MPDESAQVSPSICRYKQTYDASFLSIALCKGYIDKGGFLFEFLISPPLGRAWGIYLRFERKDVPARLLKKGPEHYAMPELLG